MGLSLEEKICLAREKLHNDIRDVKQKLKSLGFDGMELDDQVRMLGMKLKDKKQNECPTELLPQIKLDEILDSIFEILPILVKWLEGGVSQGSLCKSPEEKRLEVLSLIHTTFTTY
ncbi:hypothetical protein OROMI_023127 [Orobanche minor]